MITLNIGISIFICVCCAVLGFIIAAVLAGSKIKELDNNIKNEKILNSRKDCIINFYKESNANSNNKNINSKTANTDERKRK